jgi:hypothetical protein
VADVWQGRDRRRARGREKIKKIHMACSAAREGFIGALLLLLLVLGACGDGAALRDPRPPPRLARPPPLWPRALALRGGMPLPHYVPARDEAAEREEREYAEMMAEHCLDVERRADEIKTEYPTAALSMATNGSLLENQPLCVTREDFARHGIDPTVPQILPLGGANHSRVRIMAGQEVTEMVRREAPLFPGRPPLNLSDPEVRIHLQMLYVRIHTFICIYIYVCMYVCVCACV